MPSTARFRTLSFNSCTRILSLRSAWTGVLALVLVVTTQPAWALVGGEVGNKPVKDPGWPAGAATVFNVPGRAAWYWADFGYWFSECRGDAQAFSKVLADFARIKAERKQVIVHDGVGSSYWLSTFEKDKDPDHKVDWIFLAPTPSRTRRQLNPGNEPIPKIDVYTGGRIDWDKVVIPYGLHVVDTRLESHGFKLSDGNVIEGTVKDLVTGKPLAATMQLETERTDHKAVRKVKCDARGHWVVTSAPQGRYRITLVANGYAPRVVRSVKFTDQPGWSSHDTGMAPAVKLSGIVKDEDGKPVEGATVRLVDVVTKGGVHYGEKILVTDSNGRFETDQVPEATITVWTFKDGFVLKTDHDAIKSPAKDVELRMGRAGRVEVVVDFGDKSKPGDYIVNIEGEKGSEVGSWGGSASVSAKGRFTFKNVPPGKYTLWGRPNPGRAKEETKKVTVELVRGKSARVTLKAR